MKTFGVRCNLLLPCVVLALAIGCDMNPVAENSSTDSSPTPSTAAQTDDNSDTGEKPPTGVPTPEPATTGTATAETPPTTPADTANDAGAAAAEGTATAETGTQPATEAPAELPGTASVAALNNPQATAIFERIRDTLAADPKNVEARLQLMGMLQQVGMVHARTDAEKGYDAFLASAEVAEALIADNQQLPAEWSEQIGTVFYNQACALAMRGKPAEAMAALEKSIERGFNDVQLMKNDPDLVSVRELPEFAGKLEGWEKKVAEIARQHAEDMLASGETFPFDFAVTDIEGNPHKLSDYKGKVLIVDIWGTWCPPCRAEIPSFIALQEKYGPEGFQMFGLNYERVQGDEALKLVKDFVAEFKVNYPCAIGDQATQDQVPNLTGYPTTLFIDKTGKVRLKVVGAHPYTFLESIVNVLMEEPDPAATEATGG